jgi:hypothetical protein
VWGAPEEASSGHLGRPARRPLGHLVPAEAVPAARLWPTPVWREAAPFAAEAAALAGDAAAAAFAGGLEAEAALRQRLHPAVLADRLAAAVPRSPVQASEPAGHKHRSVYWEIDPDA